MPQLASSSTRMRRFVALSSTTSTRRSNRSRLYSSRATGARPTGLGNCAVNQKVAVRMLYS
jgi:hypothetical protein